MAWTSRIVNSLPAQGLSLRDIAACLRMWWQRSRSRRQLPRLDDSLFRDIGVDRHVAEEEGRKPFWRA